MDIDQYVDRKLSQVLDSSLVYLAAKMTRSSFCPLGALILDLV